MGGRNAKGVASHFLGGREVLTYVPHTPKKAYINMKLSYLSVDQSSTVIDWYQPEKSMESEGDYVTEIFHIS